MAALSSQVFGLVLCGSLPVFRQLRLERSMTKAEREPAESSWDDTAVAPDAWPPAR
jgi:hypothetical protein